MKGENKIQRKTRRRRQRRRQRARNPEAEPPELLFPQQLALPLLTVPGRRLPAATDRAHTLAVEAVSLSSRVILGWINPAPCAGPAVLPGTAPNATER